MDRASVQERFGIVGRSAALMHVIDKMRLVAPTDANVLIEGESGVGKEVIAKAIHQMSPRKHKSLIVVNCGAIPEGLIESELFGAEKGAYTGAVERRHGHFEEADEGTLFLDEIGEMPLAAQVRLLRVLETGEYSRVGSSTTQKSDARVIAATNKDLDLEVRAGRFREDLYYRLSTVIIRIPPLRERPEDIMPLFTNFLHQFTQRYNSSPKNLDDEARQLILRYRWPGNVRELRNLAEQIVVLMPDNIVSVDDISPYLRGISSSGGAGELVPASGAGTRIDSDDLSDVGARERELIYRALLELRLDIREMKDQMARISGSPTVPSKPIRRDDFADEGRPFIIVDEEEEREFRPEVEDVPYEIESPNDGRQLPVPFVNGNQDEPSFPTLEDAERRLITDALRFFKGNRRQTAKALGISERTLYRKLKDIDEPS